jgi:magnesium-transporting ATPase (P-type)
MARCLLSDEVRARVVADVDALAAEGLRVLAFAGRTVEGGPPQTAAEAEHDLTLMGLVGLADPVRPEVPEAIARCREAGIRVVMVTGDHPSTAAAVAAKAGLPAGPIVLGVDLPTDDDALRTLLADHAVSVPRGCCPNELFIARAFSRSARRSR